jgi:antitoxin component YwqK of YwqJK toxin-antitoxin module
LVLGACREKTKTYDNGKYTYVGTFNKDGQREGKGKWYEGDILMYEGEYFNDYPNGQGKMYDEDGNLMYKGEFQYGKPVPGKGVTYMKDGTSKPY